jgi:hypothetical protein
MQLSTIDQFINFRSHCLCGNYLHLFIQGYNTSSINGISVMPRESYEILPEAGLFLPLRIVDFNQEHLNGVDLDINICLSENDIYWTVSSNLNETKISQILTQQCQSELCIKLNSSCCNYANICNFKYKQTSKMIKLDFITNQLIDFGVESELYHLMIDGREFIIEISYIENTFKINYFVEQSGFILPKMESIVYSLDKWRDRIFDLEAIKDKIKMLMIFT